MSLWGEQSCLKTGATSLHKLDKWAYSKQTHSILLHKGWKSWTHLQRQNKHFQMGKFCSNVPKWKCQQVEKRRTAVADQSSICLLDGLRCCGDLWNILELQWTCKTQRRDVGISPRKALQRVIHTSTNSEWFRDIRAHSDNHPPEHPFSFTLSSLSPAIFHNALQILHSIHLCDDKALRKSNSTKLFSELTLHRHTHSLLTVTHSLTHTHTHTIISTN